MFIQSEDGAHAFADYQTIVNTCNLNKVPVQPYLMWLCANIKLRLTERLNDGHSDPTYFTMPHKQAVKDKDGKVTGYIVCTMKVTDSVTIKSIPEVLPLTITADICRCSPKIPNLQDLLCALQATFYTIS